MKWEYGLLFDNVETFLTWFQTLGVFRINSFHFHHTYLPNHTTWRQSPNHRKVQDGMKNYHVQTNGWDDIAQHVTLFPDGKIMTGRDPGQAPVSAKGYNGNWHSHPFMAECIGNFDEGHDKLGGAQLVSAVAIARYWHRKGMQVIFHRECLIDGKQPKSCPGTGIDKGWFMEQIFKEDEYMMSPEDANKIIKFLGVAWDLSVDQKSKDEFNRLANEVRKSSGQKAQ